MKRENHCIALLGLRQVKPEYREDAYLGSLEAVEKLVRMSDNIKLGVSVHSSEYRYLLG